jgi:hypothetical protein
VSRLGRAAGLAKDLVRAVTRRRVRVSFGDITRVQPISARFGDDRGQPIDRYYIERFLTAHRSAIRGDVMEIGGSRYARMFADAPHSIQVLHATDEHPEATLVGDLTRVSTLPASAVDCLICTQTLGFIFDVPAAVAGIEHVLRPGGIVLATVGGISQVSRYDMDRWGDYWRFTDAAIRGLFAELFADLEVVTFGNVAASVAFLQGIAVDDLPDRCVLDATDPDYQLVIGVAARKRGRQ